MFRPEHIDGGAPSLPSGPIAAQPVLPARRPFDPRWIIFIPWAALMLFGLLGTILAGLYGGLPERPKLNPYCGAAAPPGAIAIPAVPHYETGRQVGDERARNAVYGLRRAAGDQSPEVTCSRAP